MRETLDKVEIREWAIIENEGQQIFGVLHRPISVENPPIAVILHGFASSKVGSNRCYVILAEKLAQEGIAAFRFDFRGCGDSEGTLSDITFEDLISDAVCVLENLGTFEGINTSRVALFGASLGGTIALLTAARTKNVKTMALWAPVASGELWYRDFLMHHPEHIHSDPGIILSSYGGVQLHPLFREQFAKMYAYKALQQLQPLPILHMHGEKDETISISHQEAFRAACPPSQSHVRFIKYPDGQHSLGYSASFPEVIGETIQWFKRFL